MNIAKLLYQLRNWRAHWRAFYLGSYIVIEGARVRIIRLTIRLLMALGLSDGDLSAGFVRMAGVLNARVIRADGTVLDLGCLGRRLVTTAFVNYLRDDLANGAGAADISSFKYHACGTGAIAEAIGDTALGAECTTALNPDTTRAVGSQVNTVAKTYTSVGTLLFDAAAAVTEHGLLNAAAAGVLMDRTVFAAINVAAGDSIQFTYSLTIADGG